MKNFDDWHRLKERVDGRNPPAFRECEVWWANIGENVGHEENGKGEVFSRPILVVRKFSKHLFWGVPLTTQNKDNPYYYALEFNGRTQSLMLSQLRAWDAKRLTQKLGRIHAKEFRELRSVLKNMI